MVGRTPEPERYLSTAEVARQLGFSEQTIRDWIESKKLPAIKIQRNFRIKQSDIDRIVESFSTAMPSEGESFWEDPDAQSFQAPGRGK